MQSNENPFYKGEKILSEIDSNLINYSNHIVDLFLKNLRAPEASSLKVIDFGAGQGTLAEIWAKKTSNKPICVELDPLLINILSGRGYEVFSNIGQLPFACDLIYSSNVLEHIEDDVRALKEVGSKLKPSGLLLIYVPAFRFLFSELDVRVGHFRRYSRVELNSKLDEAGYEVVSSEYSDSLGFFATLFLKFLRFSFSPSSSTSNLMKFYDDFLVPVSIFADKLLFKFVVGKNIFAVAKLKQV